jgi:hypothetical protein
MSVSAIRVPLVFIEIDAWAEMTVSTSVIVNQAVTINAESSVSINAVRIPVAQILFAADSGFTVSAILKWSPEPDTSETWTSIPDQSEDWTAVSDNSTSWAAQSDTPESWTPISDNSETWQIAA